MPRLPSDEAAADFDFFVDDDEAPSDVFLAVGLLVDGDDPELFAADAVLQKSQVKHWEAERRESKQHARAYS